MSITISYNILFEVKILHHFFLNNGEKVFDRMTADEKADMMLKYDAREIFDIYPSEECTKFLKSHHCIFRTTSQGILVGIRAESDGQSLPGFKPYQSLADDLTLSFVVHIKDSGFMNYTALPLMDNSGRIYIFQNLVGAAPRLFPSLSTGAPLHKPQAEYMPGDMLSDNIADPSELYVAKLKTIKPTSESSDWLTEKKGDGFPVSYANINDQCRVIRGILLYRVKVPDVKPFAIVKTAAGIMITPDVNLLAGEYRILQVDLRGFPEGFYSLHVQTDDLSYQDDLFFYLMQMRESPFGIIRLTVKSDDSQYDMLDTPGFLKNPVYEIRFRNRATHWRYIGKIFNETSVTDNPMPLTRYGIIKNVTVTGKDGNPVDDLPNPAINMIRTEAFTKSSEKKFYSEIHIH